MSQTAMDAAAFGEMKELMGDAFSDMISLSLLDLPKQSLLLEDAIASNDADQVFIIAHRLKGTSSTIGALGLAKKAEVIELIGREGSMQGAKEAFTHLQVALEQVLGILKKEIT